VSPQWQIFVRSLVNKRVLAITIVLAVLVLLLSHEMNAWRKFDWSIFLANARYMSLFRALMAVAIIHAGFLLRAVRWSILLRHLRTVPTARLLGPTFVGFTGLALLGRPGELIRPYLVARKEGLSISSQMAALTLERIFDIASAGALIVTAVLVSSELRTLPYAAEFRRGALVLIASMAVLAVVVLLLAKNRENLGRLFRRILSPLSIGLANKAGELAGTFAADLNMIRDAKSMTQIAVLSISIWSLIGLAYLENVHAFSSLWWMSPWDAVLLMGFGLFGSVVQLPGGGTPQLIVFAALVHVFGISTELAASCSILGWLTIFMAPVPLGMVLLRHEHSSLHALVRSSADSRTVQKSSHFLAARRP
jgi:glycosyltransferase 2 family protein